MQNSGLSGAVGGLCAQIMLFYIFVFVKQHSGFTVGGRLIQDVVNVLGHSIHFRVPTLILYMGRLGVPIITFSDTNSPLRLASG